MPDQPHHHYCGDKSGTASIESLSDGDAEFRGNLEDLDRGSSGGNILLLFTLKKTAFSKRTTSS